LPSDIHKKDKDLYTIHDLQEWIPPKIRHIIWDGILDVGHRLQIFGDEGTWKSMLATHMMYSVSTGSRWLGFKTSPANVFYVQGEMGMYSVRTRSLKYTKGTERIYLAKPGNVPEPELRAKEKAYPPNVYTQVVQFFHLDEQAGIASLRNKLDTVIMQSPNLPIVLILDPLYKMFHHDLTVAKEVNYFCENMDLLLKDYNECKNGVQRQLAMVFVHHSRKAGVDKEGNRTSQDSEDSFGAKQLAWWSDTILKTSLNMADDTKTSTDINFTKHSRDAEGMLPKLIKLRWNKDTLHPHITARIMPEPPEDELQLRGDTELQSLE
jgi:RecA-family ATPase